MVTLWQRMAEIFGNQWELNYGAVNQSAFRTWTEGLAAYSEQQIAQGVKQCSRWESGFLPNLGQFARLCLSGKPAETVEAEHRVSEVKSLEDFTRRKRTDSPIAAAEKEKIRRILAGEEVETKAESYAKLHLPRLWGRL